MFFTRRILSASDPHQLETISTCKHLLPFPGEPKMSQVIVNFYHFHYNDPLGLLDAMEMELWSANDQL